MSGGRCWMASQPCWPSPAHSTSKPALLSLNSAARRMCSSSSQSRTCGIVHLFLDSRLFSRRTRQRDGERAADAELAFERQVAAVHVFHDVPGQRQPQASAGRHLLVLLHAVEFVEHLLAIFRTQTDARILDVELHVPLG